MKLTNVIEECSDIKDQITTQHLWIISQEYQDEEVIKMTKLFLKGIGKTLEVPGRVIDTMMNIIQFYEAQELMEMITPKQKIYLLANAINYWHHMDPEFRCMLYA